MQIDIEVRPLKKNIGAEIRGVDLSRSLPDQTIKKIREVWINHVVAVFPNQKVNDEQHIKFSKRLGKLEIINMSALQMKGRPEIYEATKSSAGKIHAGPRRLLDAGVQVRRRF